MTLNRNFICLIALAVVGEGILIFSFSSNTASDIIGIISAILLCLLAALVIKAAVDFYGKKNFRHKEAITCLISFLFCIIMVLAALNTAFEFSKYAASAMLRKNVALIPFGIIILLSLLTAFSEKKVLFKMGLVLFSVSVVFIILMFGFSVPFMSVKYLIPYKSFYFEDSFNIFKDFSLSLFPVILPAVVLGKNEKKRGFLFSFALGGGLLALCFVNTMAIFGSEFASTLSYPYSLAVSTAEFGELFYRMDGFLYAVCFFSCFVKISSFLTAVILLLKEVIYKIILRKI